MKTEEPRAKECIGCLTDVLLMSLEGANKEMNRLRLKISELEKSTADAVAERYALQEQIQLMKLAALKQGE